MHDSHDLTIAWSPVFQPQWDATPEAYLADGIVGWGRSRRLARCADPARAFKAYLGVHHSDLSAWGGVESTRFFLSLFVNGQTIALRTFATLPEAMTELHAFHTRLSGSTAS